MDFQSPYGFVIAISVIVILSYFFNLIAEKTNVPSVLLLIFTGIGLKYLLPYVGFDAYDLFPVLEVLGIVGLIMIVLEAALDLKLKKEKRKLIVKSFVVALLGFFGSLISIAYVIQYFLECDTKQSLIYAIPMAILSSAIVIPSVEGLSEHKREFLIYESTFSDILGIMFFYLFIQGVEADTVGEIVLNISWNIVATVLLSIVISYLLVYVFQNLTSRVKLFLLISVLILLYAIGKMLHLSSLLIILVFGLVLNNQKVFFKGKLNKWLKPIAVKRILIDFRLVTIESAFIIRTFFFVVFGASIAITSLFNIQVFLESVAILISIYAVRYIVFLAVVRKKIRPQLYIAPRGLITILLFYAIPEEFTIPEFDNGTLLYVILVSSLVMTWSLIANRKKELFDDQLFDGEVPSYHLGKKKKSNKELE